MIKKRKNNTLCFLGGEGDLNYKNSNEDLKAFSDFLVIILLFINCVVHYILKICLHTIFKKIL